MAITLVGKAIAKEGSEFYYIGPAEECDGCKLRNVCHNLEEGTRFRVTSVRGQEHACALLEDEPVVAVEVEKTTTPAILPKKGLLEGITITYSVSKCDEIGCPEGTGSSPWTSSEAGRDFIGGPAGPAPLFSQLYLLPVSQAWPTFLPRA